MQKYRVKGGSQLNEVNEEERLPLVMQYTDIGEILDQQEEEGEEGLREKRENLLLMEYNSKINNLNPNNPNNEEENIL